MTDKDEMADIFWDNVEQIKKKERLEWADIAVKVGSDSRKLIGRHHVHNCPDLAFAYNISNALDTTLESLCTRPKDGEAPVSDKKQLILKRLEQIDDEKSLSIILSLLSSL